MASNLKMSDGLRDAMMDAIETFAGASALLNIYDGTQPTDGDTALGAQVLLAQLVLNANFGGASSNGVITLNAIADDVSANATGTATWFRILKSDATTKVMDGSVGTSGADLNLSTTSIVAGGLVSVTSATLTHGNA